MTSLPPDPSAPQKTNTAKWLALGCGGCLTLTLLLGLGLAFVINRTLRFAVGPTDGTTDSAELFSYNLPGESQGIFNFGLLGMQLIQVTSSDADSTVLLTMGQMPRYIQGREAQRTFIEQFQESAVLEGNYQLTESRIEERALCGQPVSVMVQAGQFEDGGTVYNASSLLTVVDYNNSARFVWLLTHGDEPAATADQVFATLDCQ